MSWKYFLKESIIRIYNRKKELISKGQNKLKKVSLTFMVSKGPPFGGPYRRGRIPVNNQL